LIPPQLVKKPIECLWRQKIELINSVDPLFFQPFIEAVEMSLSVFDLLQVLWLRVVDLGVVFDFYYVNSVPLLDEEIGAEIAALWMLAFFPGVFNCVKSLG